MLNGRSHDRRAVVQYFPSLIKDTARSCRFGVLSLEWFLHFLSREKKTKQKKTPVSRYTLRVAAAAGARGNSPACRRAQTVRAL